MKSYALARLRWKLVHVVRKLNNPIEMEFALPVIIAIFIGGWLAVFGFWLIVVITNSAMR